MTLLRAPVAYGSKDLTFTTKREHRMRVYFPSAPDKERPVDPSTAEIMPGDYPLLVFVHGDRGSSPEMCPPDWSTDYTRWGGVLHLLARCGFVVVAPDVSGPLGSGNETSAAAEAALLVTGVIRWMYEEWEHRETLLTVIGQQSYPMGLIGHSWGALVCARLAGSSVFPARAVATISGTWTSETSKQELVAAGAPVLFITGTSETSLFAQPDFQPYPEAGLPKHQAALQRAGHWDWFPPGEDIFPCSGASGNPCPVAWQAASELCLTFFYKYLYRNWFLRPYLISSPGRRPPLLPSFQPGTSCAIKIRWETEEEETSHGRIGEVTLGDWAEGSPW